MLVLCNFTFYFALTYLTALDSLTDVTYAAVASVDHKDGIVKSFKHTIFVDIVGRSCNSGSGSSSDKDVDVNSVTNGQMLNLCYDMSYVCVNTSNHANDEGSDLVSISGVVGSKLYSEPFREASISSSGEETNLSLKDTNITKEQSGLGLDLHTLNHNDVYSYADASSKKSACTNFVLDAPALQDDFYLNLVDWSLNNVLAVGLRNYVYIWNACSSNDHSVCWLGGYNGGLVLFLGLAMEKFRTLVIEVEVKVFCNEILAHKKLLLVCGLKWSYDNRELAFGGNDNRLFVWIQHSTQHVLKYYEHMAAVKAIAWFPHVHRLLASGGEENRNSNSNGRQDTENGNSNSNGRQDTVSKEGVGAEKKDTWKLTKKHGKFKLDQ
nr:protein fizzy-related 2-like [Tanacetum cinerariifolium]